MVIPDADEIEAFKRLQAKLPAIWAEVHEQPRQPHSCLIIPSLSFDQEELQKVKGVPFYEERLMFMLMRLRRPGVRIMYITSQPVEEDIVDYYLQMLVGIPPLHAKRRLTMLCVQDASPRALTEKILERPRVVERIRQWIGDRDRAYMSCFTTSPLERTLAVQLGIPLNGADPDLLWLGSKSGSRETFREAGIELPAGFENLKDERAAVVALDTLKRDKPELRRAVVKLNDGFSGEGNALFTYPSAMPEAEAARHAAIRAAFDTMKFSAPEHSKGEFFAKYAQMGGIVEEFLEADEVHSPSVQLRITPAGQLHIISTHDQALGGDSGQVYLGCRFPANIDYRSLITERAYHVGEVLRERGVLGRFAIDFLVCRKAGADWRCAAIEINLRMGGTTFPYIALDFLIGGAIGGAGDYRSRTGVQKYYFATDALVSPAYRGLLPQDFLEIVIHHGLHWSPQTETGVLFHMIGALSQFGKLGVICIADSAQEADDLYQRTRDVLDMETHADRTGRGQMHSMFDDFPHLMD
ncbi:MAG: carboxylate-amine ligase [Planctomycetes bacterium]|nr:carboxylate-amine ligase [Planctomycetota bacterium]